MHLDSPKPWSFIGKLSYQIFLSVKLKSSWWTQFPFNGVERSGVSYGQIQWYKLQSWQQYEFIYRKKKRCSRPWILDSPRLDFGLWNPKNSKKWISLQGQTFLRRLYIKNSTFPLWWYWNVPVDCYLMLCTVIREVVLGSCWCFNDTNILTSTRKYLCETLIIILDCFCNNNSDTMGRYNHGQN